MKSHSNFDAKARTHDPKTSWEAAEKVDTNRLEGIVLRAIKESGAKGAIHDDVYARLELHKIRESSITPRYKQLENKGLIYWFDIFLRIFFLIVPARI